MSEGLASVNCDCPDRSFRSPVAQLVAGSRVCPSLPILPFVELHNNPPRFQLPVCLPKGLDRRLLLAPIQSAVDRDTVISHQKKTSHIHVAKNSRTSGVGN